jgi:hypothetical protein
MAQNEEIHLYKLCQIGRPQGSPKKRKDVLDENESCRKNVRSRGIG